MRYLTLTIILLSFSSIGVAQNVSDGTKIESKPFSIGEILSFHSKELGEERTLNIYLPNAYHPDSLKKYPVIYLLDGSADEDFIHIAGLVQFGSFPWLNIIPESIVVGHCKCG